MLEQFLALLGKYFPWQRKGTYAMYRASHIYQQLSPEDKEKAWRAHNAHVSKELRVTTVENFTEYMNDCTEWNFDKIERIIACKAEIGEDCLEEESGYMKMLIKQIAHYFPAEFSEALEEQENPVTKIDFSKE